MIERIRVIIRKELLQTLREPRMRGMLIMPPIIQLIIFGFAANLDVDRARLAWMDFDRTEQSREFLSRLEGSGRFEVVATPDSDASMQRLMDHGDVDAVGARVPRLLPGRVARPHGAGPGAGGRHQLEHGFNRRRLRHPQRGHVLGDDDAGLAAAEAGGPHHGRRRSAGIQGAERAGRNARLVQPGPQEPATTSCPAWW